MWTTFFPMSMRGQDSSLSIAPQTPREASSDGANSTHSSPISRLIHRFVCNITGTGMSSNQIQDRLLSEADIAVVAGSSFGALGDGYIRISYAAGMDELAEAIERIRKLFGSRG